MNNNRFFSPAKLNLFFRVLKKRPDGFHDIATLYQAIDLGDELVFSKADKDALICTHPQVPKDPSNLILRAKDLFCKKTGLKQSFSIELKKKIPVESGLGGGSSNAATTLWALNQLLGTRIDDFELAKWGAELGSDVPFFFTRGRALAEGRGEILRPVAETPAVSLWVAKPKEGLSTAAVYKALRVEQTLQQSVSYFNDLEIPAFQLMPKLRLIKEQLQEMGFKEVHLTGSGSAFFCLGDVQPSPMDQVDFYPVNFLRRQEDVWYKFPS